MIQCLTSVHWKELWTLPFLQVLLRQQRIMLKEETCASAAACPVIVFTAGFALQVRVVASLPCYSKDNVDSQRGGGTFRRSIEGLRRLNAVGYGMPESQLKLDLVYNPNGVFLAPSQAVLEPAYKSELKEAYDIQFNSLLCLNNMPIKRYWDYLERRGEVSEYMQLLEQSFNPDAGEKIMCRDTISVSWDGTLCDSLGRFMRFYIKRCCSSWLQCHVVGTAAAYFHGLTDAAKTDAVSRHTHVCKIFCLLMICKACSEFQSCTQAELAAQSAGTIAISTSSWRWACPQRTAAESPRFSP